MESNPLHGPVLPLEIFQLIIQDVASGELTARVLRTIKSCCVVSRAFVPLCRPYIFRHAKFGPYGPGNESRKKLAQIVKDQPHILAYIKQLTFDLNTNDFSMHDFESTASDSEENPDTLQDHITSSSDDESAIMLANQLPNIKILSLLHTLCNATDSYTVCTNPRCLRLVGQTLGIFSTSLNLTQLTLESVVVPLSMLVALPRLEVAEIHNVSLQVSDMPDFPEIKPFIESQSMVSSNNSLREKVGKARFMGCSPLRSIKIRGGKNFYRTMFSLFPQLQAITLHNVSETDHNRSFYNKLPVTTRVPRLESLSIAHSGNMHYFFDIDELEKGGNKAFPSLKSLKVDEIMCIMCDYQGLDDLHNGFQHIQVLESLSLSTKMGDICNLNLDPVIIGCRSTFKNLKVETNYGGHYDESLIRILCDALTAVRGDNVVETIDLTLVTYCTGPAEGGWMKVPSFEHWKRLDSLLMKNRAVDFPCLRKVKVCVNFDEVESPEVGSVSDCWIGQRFLEKPLQRLMATKEIEFSCSHYPADDYDLDF